VELLGVKDEFPEHARISQLQDLQGISPEKIKQRLLTYCT
jgi:transketolase C-terminal domain/subunit